MTRDDIQRALNFINNHITFKESRNIGVGNEEITIRTVLQDRLNQPDYKEIVDNLNTKYKDLCEEIFEQADNDFYSYNHRGVASSQTVKATDSIYFWIIRATIQTLSKYGWYEKE